MRPDDPDAEASEPQAERLAVLAEGLQPAAPAASVRSALLQQLQGPERFTPHARRVAAGFGLPLADVTEALRRISDASAWRQGFWPGSRQLIAEKLAAANTLVTELPAGFRIAHHRHEARELTYVLDGEMLENGQIRHGTGILLEMLPGSAHEVAVTERGPCLVVFAMRHVG